MVDFNHLAIADCLVHPILGVVSFQPSIRDPITDEIMVRDMNFSLHKVLASECQRASEEQRDQYWAKNNYREVQ